MPYRIAYERPDRWGWIEAFVLIQTLSASLLFLPGSQPYRFLIRALPYGSSLGLALMHFNRTKGRMPLPPGGILLACAFVLLLLNVVHPTTNFPAGIAQCAFQLCIAAPVIWVAGQVNTISRMERILWLLLLTNGVSALVGLAQVFYPATFMPELSSLALSLNPNAVKSMTYVGSLGQQIVRPPGLTDMPGGAAIGGLTSAFLGIVLGSRERQSMPLRFFCFGLATVGITVIYFSQIRSLLILLVLAITGMCVLLLRQTRFVQSAWIGGTCLLLLAVTFGWAVAVGGRSVFDRFTSITDVGLEQSFQQNRGIFIKQTVETLVAEYPFGAGVGRWGMMNVYFPGDSSQPAPIWVEIQMTGWLLDGGLLMWFLYGGAIMVSLFYLYRTTTSVVDPQLCHLASVVLCLNLFVFGLSFAGPAFNNQLGLQFWFLTAALYGVATRIVPVQIHANETPRMTVGNGTLPAGYSARIGE